MTTDVANVSTPDPVVPDRDPDRPAPDQPIIPDPDPTHTPTVPDPDRTPDPEPLTPSPMPTPGQPGSAHSVI